MSKMRPLWLEKIDDKKLKDIIGMTKEVEMTMVISNMTVLNILETWYSDSETRKEQIDRFCLDVYKEAAIRWSGK